MNDSEETAYGQGYRGAFTDILSTCLRELGYEDTEATRCKWVRERESAVSALRKICRNWGDNDWDDDLSLADVIEKHLRRNLGEPHKETGIRSIQEGLCARLSKLLRTARDFGDGDGYLAQTNNLKASVIALNDVLIEGDIDQYDDEGSIVKVITQDDEILTLGRDYDRLERQYTDLKKLYDVRMEVTQEAVRVKNEEIRNLFNVFKELEDKIRRLEIENISSGAHR